MKLAYFILILILSNGCVFNSADTCDIMIQNVNVIDMETGGIHDNMDIIVNEGKITRIQNHDSEGKMNASERISGTGKYLIPGLWDMHVHIQDSSYLNMFLKFGIVGVRDMGGCASSPTDGCESLCPERLVNWRELIKAGQMIGPEMYIAGPVLTGTGWPTALPANTVSQVQNSFEKLLQLNVDFVKVYEKIPAEPYREIARLCKLNNIDFVGHVSESLLLSEVSDMGQKSIEHIREPILYCFTNDPDELESFMVADSYTQEDRAFVRPWIEDADKAIESFKRNNTWFVPTMAVQYARQRSKDSLWINHPMRKQLPESVNKGLSEHIDRIRDNPDKIGDSLWWLALKKLVKRLNDNNIGLLAGSDLACEGGLPGLSLHEELQLLTEANLTPLEALRTATINPAKFLDLPFRGQIKESFYADMILLNANPLDSIKNTLSINLVIRNGKVIKE